jgi:hypothetical protein
LVGAMMKIENIRNKIGCVRFEYSSLQTRKCTDIFLGRRWITIYGNRYSLSIFLVMRDVPKRRISECGSSE